MDGQTSFNIEPPPDTQKGRILRHLREHKTITRAEGFSEYGICELPARICELKRQGYAIGSKTKTSKNRYGEPVSYSEYYLVQ